MSLVAYALIRAPTVVGAGRLRVNITIITTTTIIIIHHQQGCTNFPKIYEQTQNSRHQKRDPH